MFNYCFDSCQHNQVPRRSIEDGVDDKGNVKRITEAEGGKNEKLKCDLGFKTTANSKEAVQNVLKNGGQLCRFLKQVLR
jgi:hypothetical protein